MNNATKVVIFSGTLTAMCYADILEVELFLPLDTYMYYPANHRFQLDNDPKHTLCSMVVHVWGEETGSKLWLQAPTWTQLSWSSTVGKSTYAFSIIFQSSRRRFGLLSLLRCAATTYLKKVIYNVSTCIQWHTCCTYMYLLFMFVFTILFMQWSGWIYDMSKWVGTIASESV